MRFAVAVAEPTIVEAQDRVTALRQRASQQDEPAVASNPVLRPADDNQHSGLRRLRTFVQHAVQEHALAVEGYRPDVWRLRVQLGKTSSTAALVAVSSAGANVTSCRAQKGSPRMTLA